MANHLRICTFNCRSIKSSIGEIHKLCETHDIVFLQEHWLLHFELDLFQAFTQIFLGLVLPQLILL
jgi:hypothetical protein